MSARAARCGNDPRGGFARPFNVTTTVGEQFHGVEFPTTGLIVLATPDMGLVSAHASMDTLLVEPFMQNATIERPEETT